MIRFSINFSKDSSACEHKNNSALAINLHCAAKNPPYLGSERKLIPRKQFWSYSSYSKWQSSAECGWTLDCSCMCAVQCVHCSVWFSITGEKRAGWKGCCGCILFKKLNILTWTCSKCTTKPFTLNRRYFSSFLVRNSFICCSLQNSLSTDHGCWPNSPFPLTACWHLHLWMMWGHSVPILYSQMRAWSTAMYWWVDMCLLFSSLH